MRIPELSRVIKLAAGSQHMLALTAEGDVYTWGANDFLQCGRAPRIIPLNRPMPAVETLHRHRRKFLTPEQVSLKRIRRTAKIVNIGCGAKHSFVITDQGDTVAWGYDDYNQTGIHWTPPTGLGLAPLVRPKDNMAYPHVLWGFGYVQSEYFEVTGGDTHTVAFCPNTGDMWTWGRIDLGATGLIPGQSYRLGRNQGQTARSTIPVKLTLSAAARTDVAGIAAGLAHTLAFTREGWVYTWGDNTSSQTGQPLDDIVQIPRFLVRVPVGMVCHGAAAGCTFTMIGGQVCYALLFSPSTFLSLPSALLHFPSVNLCVSDHFPLPLTFFPLFSFRVQILTKTKQNTGSRANSAFIWRLQLAPKSPKTDG
jgi:regulator of chromosome condensation